MSKSVVVGDERPGQRAARDGMHHRRLDLDVSPLVEEAADLGDEGAPETEDVHDLGIHDQVEIAPAVTELDVLESVPFLRKGMEAFRQKGEGVSRRRSILRSAS